MRQFPPATPPDEWAWVLVVAQSIRRACRVDQDAAGPELVCLARSPDDPFSFWMQKVLTA